MRNKFHKQLKTPRFAKSFSSLRAEVSRNLNLSMFLEDIRLGIMPIGGESDRVPNFSVEIQGKHSDEPRVVTILESLVRRYEYNSYSRRPLEEIVE